jgi:two-component system phosphate regulon sensor histidine kinase PhoR
LAPAPDRDFAIWSELEEKTAMWRTHRMSLSVLLAGMTAVTTLWATGAVWFAFAVLFLATGIMHYLASGQRGENAEETVAVMTSDPGHDHKLIDQLPDSIILFGPEGDVTHANPQAKQDFSSLAVGTQLTAKFRSAEMRALIERVVATGLRQSVTMTDRVQVPRSFNVTAVLIDGAAPEYALIFRDISELDRIDRMRADFVANASHELRTPLATVSGFIETLQGPARNDDAARERFLHIMSEQTRRMSRLIDDLLSLSRLEMLAAPNDRKPVDLVEVCRQVIENLHGRAAELGVAVELAVSGSMHQVIGGRDEILQVIENLLENALRYGSDGGKVDIVLDGPARFSADIVEIVVRDYGKGISAEHIPRITERFYRADPDAKRGGTGLGLAIVKKIVARHNGTLKIQSKPGHGSAFSIQFPLTPIK